MRRLLILLGFGVLLAAPVTFDPSVHKEFANCSNIGSAAQTLTSDKGYTLSIFDEETWVCYAASSSTCSSGGIRMSAGTVMKVFITGDLKSVSCRSANSTGDVEFVAAE